MPYATYLLKWKSEVGYMVHVHNYDLVFNICSFESLQIESLYILLLIFCTCGIKNLTDVQQLI
jgi:hypothetical protein